MQKNLDIQSFNQLLESIIEFTTEDNCYLEEIVQNILKKYNFRVDTSHALQLLMNQKHKIFTLACYRLLMFKLTYDLISEKIEWEWRKQIKDMYQELIPILNKFSQQKSTKIISKLYCEIIAEMQGKKSENLQFLLFMVFLSAEPAIKLLLKGSKIIRGYLQSKIQFKDDKISVWACVMVNYEITKFKVSSQIYHSLKKKYIKHARKQNCVKNPPKSRIASNTSLNVRGQQSIFQSMFKQIKKKNKVQNGELSEQNCQFFKDIHNIIIARSNRKKSSLKICAKKTQPIKKIREIQTDSPMAIFRENYPQIISFPRSKNSRPFQSECKQQKQNKKSKRNRDIKLLKSERSAQLRKQKQDACKKKNILFFTSSLGFLAKNKEKKPEISTNKAMTVGAWKDRIRHIRHQSNNVDQSCFRNQFGKYRKNTLHHNENQNFSPSERKDETVVIKKFDNFRTQRKEIFDGFVEHIEARQPQQMKIVKDIVNFTSYSPDKQSQKRIASREFRVQYEQFLKHIAEQQQNYNNDNFDLRLQKCITKATK